MLNEILPAEVRERLDSEAQNQNIALYDVAGAIVAKHFGLDWEPSGKRYFPMAPQFKLRVPEDLHVKLRMSAALDRRTTIRGIVVNILAAHYDLETYAPTRRPRSVPS